MGDSETETHFSLHDIERIMSRIVEHNAEEPAIVEVGNEKVYVCRCGLTKKQNGLCDGSHSSVKGEAGDLFIYTRDKNGKLTREEVDVASGCGSTCGGDCNVD